MKMELTDEKRKGICGLCFNDTGLLFVFGLFGVQSLPYGACLDKMKPYLYHTGMVSVREIL